MVLRTPMGARRGYGPTHSQTLDKFLVGIDNVKTVALNTFIDPAILYESIYGEEHPVVVIENKVDYGKRILSNPLPNFVYEANEDAYPVVRIRPVLSAPTVTLVAYGGVADVVAKALNRIFIETELKPELIVPSLISHLPVDIIKDAIEITGRLVVIEEGTSFAGIGSELISAVMEQISSRVQVQIKRITAHPVPIPAVKSLENEIVPDEDRIIREIKQRFC